MFTLTPRVSPLRQGGVPACNMSVLEPVHNKAKDGSPLDAGGESDSEAGDRMGTNRRRRRPSSASEGQLENML